MLRSPAQVPYWAPDELSPRPPREGPRDSAPLGLTRDPDVIAQLQAFTQGTHVPLAAAPRA